MKKDGVDWIGHELSAGRYLVNSQLGEGGMGQVFLAWDRNLESDVVIKVPRPSMLVDPEFAGRFGREVRSLVKLSHPRIVKIMDVGDHDGVPFAVMQFLGGGSLQDRRGVDADGNPLATDPRDLRAWLPDVAAALDFIHRQQYLHRDIKPDNILFDVHDNSYVGDFGIVKVLSEDADGEPRRTKSMTQAGIVLGTPEYMAPEMIMGNDCDGRADQYSLAATVYEMLCGGPPFSGKTPAAIIVRATTERPTILHKILPSLPKAVSQAVDRGLAKDPTQRYPTCQAFAEAVIAAIEETSGVSPIHRDRKPVEPKSTDHTDRALRSDRSRQSTAGSQPVSRDTVGNSRTTSADESATRSPKSSRSNRRESASQARNKSGREIQSSVAGGPESSQSSVKSAGLEDDARSKSLGKSKTLWSGLAIVLGLAWFFFIRTPELVVSQDGSGNFDSVSEALKQAQPGTRIRIMPGTYQVPGLIVDKPIELVGDVEVVSRPHAEAVSQLDATSPSVRTASVFGGILAQSSTPRSSKKASLPKESTQQLGAVLVLSQAIKISADHVVLQNLVLRGEIPAAPTGDISDSTVHVAQGSARLIGCDMTSKNAGAVGFESSEATGAISNCRIHDSKVQGVLVRKQARVTIDDTDLTGNLNNLDVTEQAEVVLKNCRVSLARRYGIAVLKESVATIENSQISESTAAGIYAFGDSQLKVSRSMIRDGKGLGVSISSSQATLDDCEVYRNKQTGIFVRDGKNVGLRNCRVHSGTESGAMFSSGSSGTIENCRFFDNTNCGLKIMSKSTPTVRGCSANGNKQGGIAIEDEALGTAEDCEIFGNTRYGVSITKKSNPTLRNCRIHSNVSTGLVVSEEAIGTIIDCEISKHEKPCVGISKNANPTLKRCKIHSGQDAGVSVSDSGRGLFELCEVYGNAKSGLSIKTSANPVLENCKINSNGWQAIHVYEKAKATVRNCDLTGNPRVWSISADSSVTKANNTESAKSSSP